MLKPWFFSPLCLCHTLNLCFTGRVWKLHLSVPDCRVMFSSGTRAQKLGETARVVFLLIVYTNIRPSVATMVLKQSRRKNKWWWKSPKSKWMEDVYLLYCPKVMKPQWLPVFRCLYFLATVTTLPSPTCATNWLGLWPPITAWPLNSWAWCWDIPIWVAWYWLRGDWFS